MSKVDDLVFDPINIISHSFTVLVVKGIKETEVPGKISASRDIGFNLLVHSRLEQYGMFGTGDADRMGIIGAAFPVDIQVIELWRVLKCMIFENSDTGNIGIEGNEAGVLWAVQLHAKSIQVIETQSKFIAHPEAGEYLSCHKTTRLGDG